MNVNEFCFTSVYDMPMLNWSNCGETGDYSHVRKPNVIVPDNFEYKPAYAAVFDNYIKVIGLPEKWHDYMRFKKMAHRYRCDSILQKNTSLLTLARRNERQAQSMITKSSAMQILSGNCAALLKKTSAVVDPSTTSVFLFHSYLNLLKND